MGGNRKFYPVLLSSLRESEKNSGRTGKAGSQFWPLDDASIPKQFLNIQNKNFSLIQQATIGTFNANIFHPPIAVCDEKYKDYLFYSLEKTDNSPEKYIIEPKGKRKNWGLNSAITLFCIYAVEHLNKDHPALFIPGDIYIENWKHFTRCIKLIGDLDKEKMYTIEYKGDSILFDNSNSNHLIEDFYPNEYESLILLHPFALVNKYLETLKLDHTETFSALNKRLFKVTQRKHPKIVEVKEKAYIDLPEKDPNIEGKSTIIFGNIKFEEMESIKIETPWIFPKNWHFFWKRFASTQNQNQQQLTRLPHHNPTTLLSENAENCYIHNSDKRIVIHGIKDIAVVFTQDALLISNIKSEDDYNNTIRKLDNSLHFRTNDDETIRAWGFYHLIHQEPSLEIRRLTVFPGRTQALQRHYHRTERWTILKGVALIFKDGDQFVINTGETVTIPPGCVHRLSNPGHIPLELIELQTGEFLDETDTNVLDEYPLPEVPSLSDFTFDPHTDTYKSPYYVKIKSDEADNDE